MRLDIFDALNGSRITAAYVQKCLSYGVRAIHVTINNFSTINPLPSLRDGLRELAACRTHYQALNEHVRIVEVFEDFEAAARARKLAVVLGYQNVPGVDRDLRLLELYRDLGVRVIQIAHNVRNLYGDGCAESADAGLSTLGRELVAEMNRLGLVIDLSHAGERTGLEAMELSQHPVAITHANASAVCANVRNKSGATLDALQRSGGVIGICYLPPLVRMGGDRPSHADVASHIDYVVKRIGVQHVGLGSDFITDQPAERYQEFMKRPDVYGTWPWRFPVEDVEDQQRFLASLEGIGLSSADIRAISSENWLRLFRNVMN